MTAIVVSALIVLCITMIVVVHRVIEIHRRARLSYQNDVRCVILAISQKELTPEKADKVQAAINRLRGIREENRTLNYPMSEDLAAAEVIVKKTPRS